MSRYRNALPQLGNDVFLSDGGIETVLIFQEGAELPCFASFVLLKNAEGRAQLKRYFVRFLEIAIEHDCGFILESPTWRASLDWGRKIGYTPAALEDANRAAIDILAEVREETPSTQPVVISGCIGPRGDGYDPGALMAADEAAAFHAFQAKIFADSAADMITAITMTNAPEAIGVARAAADAGMPAAISFTVELDGRLPTGQPLCEAVEMVDAESGSPPAYYMINCAHPKHFESVLHEEGAWRSRIKGLRANASTQSHAELDAATELDDGDPKELGGDYAALQSLMPSLTIFGGCCGTDHRHISEIAKRTGRV